VYELLRCYADREGLSSFQHSLDHVSVLPPGQVHVSLESLAGKLHVPAEETEKLEEYVFQLQREVHQATESSASLEKVVIAVEIWSNQLAALTLYCYPQYMEAVKDSIQMGLNNIRRLLDAKITE
jgi:hypothetical protein